MPTPGSSRRSDDGAVRVDVRRATGAVALGGIGLAVVLLGLDALVYYAAGPDPGPVRGLFDLTAEDGLGAAAMVALTLGAAAIAWLAAATGRAGAGRGETAGRVVIAAFLTWMAFDDAAMIHERVGAAIEAAGAAGGFPSYAWQIVFVPVFGGLGLFTLAFLWRRAAPGRERRLLVAAIALLALAVVMDFVEGLPRAHPLNLGRHLTEWIDLEPFAREHFGRTAYASVRHVLQALEEALEMVGMALFAAALLGAWRRAADRPAIDWA